jgi:hypothetical protein
MLSSISPLGERARQQRWVVTVSAYTAASTLAGALVGGALGAIGAASFDGRSVRSILTFVIVAAIGLAIDLRLIRTGVPGLRRQVNEDWLARYRGWVYGAGYGFQLGAAFATIVSSSITHLVFAAALLSGSTGAGVAIGATFGLARALPILANRRIASWSELRRMMAWIERSGPRVQRGALAGQLAALAVTAGMVVS